MKKKRDIKGLISRLFEGFINIVIFISIVQIVFEDIALIKGVSNNIKIILLVIGFIIDIIFSIEFIIRTINATRSKGFLIYIIYEYGWIDFICSFPLLIMNSLPAFIMLIATKSITRSSLSFIKIIRIVRAIRITRILRILRVFKILKNLQNANSKMAQNHLSQIMVIFIFSILICLVVYSFIPFLSTQNLIENKIMAYKIALSSYNQLITDFYSNSKSKDIEDLLLKIKNSFLIDEDLLSVELQNLPENIKIGNSILYKNKDYDFIFNNYPSQDFDFGFFKISFSTKKYEILRISIELLMLSAIILGSIMLLFIYLSTFVRRISDVIYIIFKGIKNKDYYLMVKIPEKYKNEEMFEFAKFYNDVYLPAKKKMYQKSEKSSKITIDDLLNMDI